MCRVWIVDSGIGEISEDGDIEFCVVILSERSESKDLSSAVEMVEVT